MEASAKSETRTAASTLAKEEMAGKTKELTVELHMAAFAVAISTRFRFYNVVFSSKGQSVVSLHFAI